MLNTNASRQPAFPVVRITVWWGLVLVALIGCGTTRPGEPVSTGVLDAAAPEEPRGIEHQLRREEQRWRGTPYRWGGTSRAGMDCSGFVRTVYRDAFGLVLPRTTEDQATTGYAVSKSTLQAGDLVFFRPSKKTRHVGIYLGNGEFAHASTSEGVTISQIHDPYWQKAYWTTRRVLPTTTAGRETTAEKPAPERPLSRRSGW